MKLSDRMIQAERAQRVHALPSKPCLTPVDRPSEARECRRATEGSE